MARGNSQANSELSRGLRAKAEDLLERNKSERAEAKNNENEYDQAMKSAIMRAQDEVDEDFRGKLMSIDEKKIAERDAEANQALAGADAEEAREAAEAAKNDDFNARVSKDLKKHKSLNYEDWTKASWYRALETSDNPELKKLEPNLWADDKDRRYLTNDYIKSATEAAPLAIREAVKKAMECWRANGNPDSYPGQRAEKLYAGLSVGYEKGSNSLVSPNIGDLVRTPGSVVTPELHTAGLKTVDKTDAYIAYVLRGANNHLTDINGNPIR